MRRHLRTFCAMALLLVAARVSGTEDRHIVISDQLVRTAEQLPVDIGTSGKRFKMNFGDYTIRDSKNGMVKSKSRSNLLGTQSSSTTTYGFSFVLGNKTTELASVEALSNSSAEGLHSLETSIGAHLSIALGRDALVRQNAFSATVSVTGDDEDIWLLLMRSRDEIERGDQAGYAGEATLTNGTRTIRIISARSKTDGNDSGSLPAAGVEFIEGDRSLCAVQFSGGGLLGGAHKKFVWIDPALDPRLKLVLAAASAALLQFDRTKSVFAALGAG